MVPTWRSSPRGQQQRKKGTGHEVNGADIDVQQAIEIFRLGGFDGAYVADSGVVDQDVETLHLADRRGDRLGAGHVKTNCSRRTGRSGKFLGGGKIDVGHPDESAGADEFFDRRLADAAGSAGDQGVPARENKGRLGLVVRAHAFVAVG